MGLPADDGSGPAHGVVGAGEGTPDLTLKQALRTPLFWQLGLGFLVCGFPMSFANTHFMVFAGDVGIAP